jgi:hypothetical protein
VNRPTSFLAILLVAIFAIAFLSALLRRRARTAAPSWPFYVKKAMSPVEQVLYHRLVKALPDRIVLAQVGLSRILGVKKGHNYGAWFNRINRMSADFVICAKDSSVLAVIELDDASHAREDRLAADAKKDLALESAGVRVVRFQVKALPDEAAIRAAVDPAPSDIPLRQEPSLSRGWTP